MLHISYKLTQNSIKRNIMLQTIGIIVAMQETCLLVVHILFKTLCVHRINNVILGK